MPAYNWMHFSPLFLPLQLSSDFIIDMHDNLTTGASEEQTRVDWMADQRAYIRWVARCLSRFATSMEYGQNSIAIIGCVCNVFVLRRLLGIIRQRPRLNPAYFLLAIFQFPVFLVTYAHTARLIFTWAPDVLKVAFCKVSMFSVHVASSFGVWCWMALSLHRYVAVFKPTLFRQRVWYVRPSHCLFAILLICVLIETWLPLATTFAPGVIGGHRRASIGDCVVDNVDPTLVTVMQLVELAATFALPVAALVCLDLAVRRFQKRLYSKSREEAIAYAVARGSEFERIEADIERMASSRRSWWRRWAMSSKSTTEQTDEVEMNIDMMPPEEVDVTALTNGALASPEEVPDSPQTHTTIKRVRRTRMAFAALKRYIKLTAFDLLLNMPHVCIRITHVLGWSSPPGPLPQHVAWFVTSTVCSHVAYLLYYTQFSINLLFLWVLYREKVGKATKASVIEH